MTRSLLFIFCLLPLSIFSQYTETFGTANRGILSPGCTGPGIGTCSNVNFTGVNWTITGNFAGIDTEGFLTVGGVMSGTDVDEEVCWVSPLLNLTGPANISVGLTWANYDFDDLIDLEWEINGSGTWIQLPNQTGQPPTPPVPQYNTSLNTIGYTVANGVNVSGSLTVMATSIGASGNTLRVRVCGDNTGGNETFTLDNVTVTNGSLPVTWISINGNSEKNKNKIFWKTAAEINNDYFAVERSLDAVNYTTIGQVKGVGNTSELTNYEFTDESVKIGNTYYYRVKQTDFDGKFNYSPIIVIKTDNLDYNLTINPNPADNFLDIALNGKLDGDLILDLVRVDGKIVETIAFQETDNFKRVDISDLPGGIYIVKSRNSSVVLQKIIVKS